MRNQVRVQRDFIAQGFEVQAASFIRTQTLAAHIKTLRMFGVVGITDANSFQRVKNYLLELACPIMYNEKKGLIWVREIGETLDKMFSGLSKFS